VRRGIGGSYVTARDCLTVALIFLGVVLFMVVYVALGFDRSYFRQIGTGP
jgi:hypothetical protein